MKKASAKEYMVKAQILPVMRRRRFFQKFKNDDNRQFYGRRQALLKCYD
jgi:hypothetical protein